MPTIGVTRDDLFVRLGRTYTQEEFELLCFEFGIELDDVTSEAEMVKKEQGSAKAEALDETVIYKIDIPANRYDLLCIEGIARSLRIFKGLQLAPAYTLVEPSQRHVLRVAASTRGVRPFACCAVLRGMTFDDKVYKSFIDLQDKLHQNICRGRKLVSLGTHDLATVKGPFTYTAEPPSDIEFVPLTEESKSWRGGDLMEHYATAPECKHLAPFVPIIKDEPLYPVIRDANGVVMSVPPIINGRHSRITLATTDVFIEVTATDLTKAHIVLDTIVTMFSEYCAAPFTVEPVDVEYAEGAAGVKSFDPDDPTGAKQAFIATETCPRLSTRTAACPVADIVSIIGVPLDPPTICELCTRMQLGPAAYDAATESVVVTVPPTRSDILHAVDIVEDVAIAYGFNKLIPGKTPDTLSVGAPLPVNHFGDQLRDEIARAGYIEMLTHGLCMARENFGNLGRPNDDSAVQLLNPADESYEVVRTSLLPGLLKCLNHNKSMPKKNGIKFFEISDVVLKDGATDVGARNERHLAACYAGLSAGFEVIHGLVDRVMVLNQTVRVSVQGGAPLPPPPGQAAYAIVECTDPQVRETFLPGRRATILYSPAQGGGWAPVGCFGVVHPNVLVKDKYDVEFPCSVVEMNLEPFV